MKKKIPLFTPAQMKLTPVREWPALSQCGGEVVKIMIEAQKFGRRRFHEFSVTPIFMIQGLAAFKADTRASFGLGIPHFISQPVELFWPFPKDNPPSAPTDWNGRVINSISTYDNDSPEVIPTYLFDKRGEAGPWDKSESLTDGIVPHKNRVAGFFEDAVEAFQSPRGTWEAIKFDGFIDRSKPLLEFWDLTLLAAQCGISTENLFETIIASSHQLYLRQKDGAKFTYPTPKIARPKFPFEKVKEFHDFAVQFCQRHDLLKF
jgi:hypothetical protein